MLILNSDTVSLDEGILKPVKTQTVQLNQGNRGKYKQIRCLTLQGRRVKLNITVLLILLTYNFGNTRRTLLATLVLDCEISSGVHCISELESFLELLTRVNVHMFTFLDIFFILESTCEVFLMFSIYNNKKGILENVSISFCSVKSYLKT